MLEALEDYVKRQKKRLERGVGMPDRSDGAKRLGERPGQGYIPIKDE